MSDTIDLKELAIEHDIPYAEDVGGVGGGEAVVTKFFTIFLRYAIIIGSMILLFNLVVAGIQWIAAGGDSGKIEKARTRITQSIVGILLLSASVAIFMIINQLLGSPITIIKSGSSSGGGGTGNGGTGNSNCPCWNGKYAETGAVGRLVNQDNSPCYRCADGGWVSAAGTCPVITCY